MKAVACLILLVLVLHQGEALKCNYCFSKDSNLCTATTTQTCSWTMNACGAIILTAPVRTSFRSCMNLAVCQSYSNTPGAFASCCTTDLCN